MTETEALTSKVSTEPSTARGRSPVLVRETDEGADPLSATIGDDRRIDPSEVAAAIELARNDIALGIDCDMLFHEDGWLEAGIVAVETHDVHIVEPHRLAGGPDDEISTRVMLASRSGLRQNLLPMRAHRVDPLRQLHAMLNGATPSLALEQMLEVERQRGRLRYRQLPEHLGYSLHVARREEAELPLMQDVVAAMEANTVPAAQRQKSCNFIAETWERRGVDYPDAGIGEGAQRRLDA